MISKEKSKPASRQKLISQNNKRKSVSNTKINIFSEPKKTIIQNILLNIPLYLKIIFTLPEIVKPETIFFISLQHAQLRG